MRRGLTLLEVLVTAALLTLVVTLGLNFLLPVMRGATRGTLRVEMQQQATMALTLLSNDLRRTSVSGLSLRSSPEPVVAAACPVSSPDLRTGLPPPMQPDGTVVWSDFFLLYSWSSSTGKLTRREWPPGPPLATPMELSILRARRLSPERLAEVVSVPNPTERVLATGVVSFEILPAPGGSDTLVVQPVRFRLVLERKGNTGQELPERFTLIRSAYLRNQKT